MPKGYSDWVRQARVFPGPPGSRPARSLVYTHSGDIYKATIGRPRRRYGPVPPARATVAGGRHRGQESGNRIIAIVVTDRQVEVWSQEPSHGWANPSLIPRDDVTNIQYLG